jgi:hypothetical protein
MSGTEGADGVLSPRALNRAMLARQFLAARTNLPLPAVLESMGLLQAQYAPSMYIGLWSRVAGFRRHDLTRALADRRVVQGTLLRATIHLVSAEDWWPIAFAVRPHRRRWWLAAQRRRSSAGAEVEAAAVRVRNLLADGPRPRGEIVAELGLDSAIWSGVNLWLDLVRVPPSGTWERRRADRYALAEAWIGPPSAEAAEDAGLELLLRRYLTGFGPASLRDAAAWAGVPPRSFDPVAERLGVQRFRDEDGKGLVDLPGSPLPGPDAPAPPRFLATWDAILLAHARRTRILREEDRPILFSTKSPQSKPSFLVDGEVAGTWRFDGERIVTEAFRPLASAVRRQVGEEAERLLDLHR